MEANDDKDKPVRQQKQKIVEKQKRLADLKPSVARTKTAICLSRAQYNLIQNMMEKELRNTASLMIMDCIEAYAKSKHGTLWVEYLAERKTEIAAKGTQKRKRLKKPWQKIIWRRFTRYALARRFIWWSWRVEGWFYQVLLKTRQI